MIIIKFALDNAEKAFVEPKEINNLKVMNQLFTLLLLWMFASLPMMAQAPMDGGVWKDNTGKHINAHGGNIFN